MKSRIAASITALAFAMMLLVSGCETAAHHEYNQTVDFTRYRTFALMPLSNQSPVSDPGAALRLAQPAREAAVTALRSKGFTETDRDKADLVVNLRGESIPRVEVRDWGYTAYPVSYGRWGRHHYYFSRGTVEVSTSLEHTLTIELFDNQTKEVIWVGWKKETGNSPITPERLRAAIDTVLDSFPPHGSKPKAP